MSAALALSAMTSAPVGRRGSSSLITGRYRSFQPSSRTKSAGPSKPSSVFSASPSRMVIRSSSPVSAKVFFAAAILVVLSSVVTTRPLPLSRTAAAKWTAEMPKDMPNSTTVFGRVARISAYSNRPASGVTGM